MAQPPLDQCLLWFRPTAKLSQTNIKDACEVRSPAERYEPAPLIVVK